MYVDFVSFSPQYIIFFNLSVMKFLEDMSGNKTKMEWLEGIDKMLGTNITSVLGEFKNIDIIQNDFQCLISEVSNTPSSKCGNLTISLRYFECRSTLLLFPVTNYL